MAFFADRLVVFEISLHTETLIVLQSSFIGRIVTRDTGIGKIAAHTVSARIVAGLDFKKIIKYQIFI